MIANIAKTNLKIRGLEDVSQKEINRTMVTNILEL
jgi:hypothetical protein